MVNWGSNFKPGTTSFTLEIQNGVAATVTTTVVQTPTSESAQSVMPLCKGPDDT